MNPCAKNNNVSAAVFFLVILFAMSSWLDVVGVWVEVPLLVSVLPERWNLPSYLAVIIQLANIGPASYAIARKIRNVNHNSATGSKADIEVILSFCIILVAFVSVLLMSFLWQETVWVLGAERSVAMLSLMFFTALSSCTSSVVFLPYMARFATPYISAYYVGQGFSGLVPGIIGLVQGIGRYDCVTSNVSETLVGNNTDSDVPNFANTSIKIMTQMKPIYHQPIFSISIFFVCLAVLFLISGAAFYFLNYSRLGVDAMVKHKRTLKHKENGVENTMKELQEIQTGKHMAVNGAANHQLLEDKEQLKNNVKVNGSPHFVQTSDGSCSNETAADQVPSHVVKDAEKQMSLATFLTLLLTVGLVAALSNGVLPSTQSYTCLPYGSLVYTLALRLSSVAGPLASLLSMVLPKADTKAVCILASIGTGVAIFHIFLATQSPNPILQGHVVGELLVIVSSIVMAACFSFVRVSIAMLLHMKGGRRELLWCGGVTQVGSFCGAVVAFVFVSVLHVFKSTQPCT